MKTTASLQKLRGGYYTPSAISDFLVRWAVQRPSDSVLEPSCGDGAFLESLARRRRTAWPYDRAGPVVAVEVDSEESAKARKRFQGRVDGVEVLNADFFAYCRDTLLPEGLWRLQARRFDAVVGNPPFIRYQAFPVESREIAFDLMRRAGLHPNKLTNTWVAFLVLSALCLSQGGRLAMVIPAELLQVNYAAEVRRFLSTFFARITIITFRRLVFSNIQQEVVLLLAERAADTSQGIRTVEVGDASDLEHFDFFENLNGEIKSLDHSTEKWTKYFLSQKDIVRLRTLRDAPGVFRFADVAEVDVGVVTGDNDFFMLRPSEASTLGVASLTQPSVSRSVHLAGLELSPSDWKSLEAGDARVRLFYPDEEDLPRLSRSAREYIRSGEQGGHHLGYKCRIRKYWYKVPSVWAPDAFALRQIHLFPKIVINRVQATTTDTIHRVRFKSGVNGTQVAGAFLNSMTLAFSEVTGRSYGGGVLTFEPSEVEALPIPLIGADELDLAYIDSCLRRGEIYKVLGHTDRILLERHLGLGHREVQRLRSAWESLRDRRSARRDRPALGESRLSSRSEDGSVGVRDELAAAIAVV